MLAQAWGRGADLGRRFGELHGRVDHFDGTSRGVLLLDYHGVVLDLRVGKHFGVVVDRGAQHVEGAEVIQPGVTRFGAKNGLQGRE